MNNAAQTGRCLCLSVQDVRRPGGMPSVLPNTNQCVSVCAHACVRVLLCYSFLNLLCLRCAWSEKKVFCTEHYAIGCT